jgi:hypothetical protein
MEFSLDAEQERMKEPIRSFLGSDDNSDAMINTTADHDVLEDRRYMINRMGE